MALTSTEDPFIRASLPGRQLECTTWRFSNETEDDKPGRSRDSKTAASVACIVAAETAYELSSYVMRRPERTRFISRPVDDDAADSEGTGETFDYDGLAGIGTEPRQIGVAGAMFLILNKMIGTGIFSTPSSIFAATGSVGISLLLWAVAGLLTLSGLSVYLEFGLAIPRSGGEKNYLERIFRRPRRLATSVFAVQIVLLGFSAGNSLAFGRYVLLAVGHPMPDGWIPRAIAVACMTFVVVLHGVFPKWGLRLTNALGIFKVLVLLLIVFSGFAALAGYRLVPDPHNFDDFWAVEKGDGYGGGGAYAYATALLQVVYSYKGWENANYVMGELKNPQRTLKIAAPLAVVGITVLYVLANVAYFAAIPKRELAKSEVIVAGLFFRNMFGESVAARSLPALVALSNIGNVLALLLHWIVTIIVLLAPPPGPAYNFIVNLYTSPRRPGSTALVGRRPSCTLRPSPRRALVLALADLLARARRLSVLEHLPSRHPLCAAQ
ncbi:hypothetical protein CHGG_07667 [Chaetomium globosum CBS 148.51]|uniref:Amino acid permease/ SLC12A domain-containing protein n=1 Tax=Chaetomium globosum (strain ATCC 6205 / CBS 148.51 / DSM 1962 / NBRC 6347 / NRRL 1970) TaxID=306901 RepID=Q2GWI7_CHAGB|nr:uncharacterized protein CHGG_07667 [Chaetomium globosum CBS 148.51]EAQ86414.1 hypothetical protein CHGG_07667 [Chaetomium globosum CBS 148.51]